MSGWMRHPATPTDLDCATQLSPYSPLVGLVKYEDIRFQGDLQDVNPWKGKPNPALDEAWENITHMWNIQVSADDMLRIKKPLTQVKAPPHLGDGYVGGIEVFHQLHCVNLIRQYTYYDYYMSLRISYSHFRLLQRDSAHKLLLGLNFSEEEGR
ncbi:hypothetical protein BO79DRAFT_214911 [Aspergillus costaricaensis CBS 115574]|uniref:Uncharacterized protein n=1 Tax=Aspergillus costaricaensis CBS 115574 TaxID=1448317 RepID=A0ACD1IN73_9EURO|nr:hypothetical protein BO79DRAFT_214911 [Aspergillus costaricaensis CBS 115574]RAK91965.1 hypothetical protein BO79DRAFT_214911 [Aspergillus costaricaensis CBS 115574]